MNEEIADILKKYLPGSFSRWTADWVNHNPATLDGKRSLHTKRNISVTTTQNEEGIVTSFVMSAEPRKKREKVADITKDKGGPIVHFVSQKETGLSKITFKELPALELSYVLATVYYLNVFRHSTLFTMPAVSRKKRK